MEILLFAFKIVLPIFLLILLGYFFKKQNIINGDFIKIANKLCYKILIPLVVFKTIFETDLKKAIDIKFILIAVISLFIYIALAILIIHLCYKDKSIKGSLIQGSFRGNFALFGIALAINIIGEAGVTAILLAFIVPIFNITSVIILAAYGENTPNIKKIGLGIITNPIIIATILALILNLLTIKINIILYKPLSDLAAMGTPLALIALGGNFKFNDLKKYLNPLIFGTLSKLFIMPACILITMIAFGYRNEYLVACIAMAATPVAISSYAMAEQSGCDGVLAGNLIVTSTTLSSFSMFIIIVILKSLNYI